MTRIVALFCAVLTVAVGGYILGGNATSTPGVALPGAANAQEAAEIDTSSIVEMSLGAEDAPVTLIEYASYTCPHCASFHAGPYKQLKSDYIDTGKVKFVYREVYFDRYGLWASMIARCAGPERFFGITDLIYEGQAQWSQAGGPAEIVEEFRKIGRVAGLDNEQIEACLQDGEKAQTLVAWFQENAEEHDIDRTPSFVLNGEKLDNMSYADMAARIEEELGT